MACRARCGWLIWLIRLTSRIMTTRHVGRALAQKNRVWAIYRAWLAASPAIVAGYPRSLNRVICAVPSPFFVHFSGTSTSTKRSSRLQYLEQWVCAISGSALQFISTIQFSAGRSGCGVISPVAVTQPRAAKPRHHLPIRSSRPPAQQSRAAPILRKCSAAPGRSSGRCEGVENR
jgi:hypothetical protein